MTNTINVILTAAITFNGAIVEKGETIELPEKSAKALIAEGSAKEGTTSEAKNGTLEPSNGNSEQEEGDGSKTSPEDEKELIRKALDDKYVSRIAELKDHAKEADVQFAHDATKAAVIEAVIEAGKAEAVLAK